MHLSILNNIHKVLVPLCLLLLFRNTNSLPLINEQQISSDEIIEGRSLDSDNNALLARLSSSLSVGRLFSGNSMITGGGSSTLGTIFYATGDAPYTSEQAVKLKQQILSLPTDAEFVVHVGDIRKTRKNNHTCTLSEYENVAAILRLSRVPVFIIVGDNEWNDCSNPVHAMKYWKSTFGSFDERYWSAGGIFNRHALNVNVQRQPNRSENFSFVHKGTLFIGLNLVGASKIVDDFDTVEWSQRLDDQLVWTKLLILSYMKISATSYGKRIVIFGHANPTPKHDRYFEPLRTFIQYQLNNSIPIMYMNGDTHEWKYQPTYLNQPSFLRVTLSGLTQDPLLNVQIDLNHTIGRSNATKAFRLNRRI